MTVGSIGLDGEFLVGAGAPANNASVEPLGELAKMVAVGISTLPV